MGQPSLNLFPVHVPIGRVTDTAGQSFDVLMTAEFARALSALLVRIGGPTGIGSDDLAVMIASSNDYQAQIAAQGQQIEALSQLVEAPVEFSAKLAAMAQQIEAMGNRLEGAATLNARLTAMGQQVDALNQQLGAAAHLNARIAKVERSLQSVEQITAFRDPFRVNWERPGKIGSLTASTVRGTTLESTVATGTAPLIVASTTQVANLNVSQLTGKTWDAPAAIGFTAPAAAKFTSINTTAAPTFGDGSAAIAAAVNGNTVIGGAFNVLNNGSLKVALGNKSAIIGGAYDATAYLWSSGTLLTSGAVQVSGAFGCNGKTPQAAVALGAAASDLASVITLANNMRTMAINNGTGS